MPADPPGGAGAVTGIDLVIFDMDGVVFEGRNFWLDLHRAMGTEDEAWRLWHRYGRTDYARLGAITVEQVWRGRSAAPFLDLVASRRYVAGAPELLGWLRARGIRSAIVSTGPLQLAERAERELGFDRVLANRVDIVDGRFAGTVGLMVDDNGKDVAARRVMAELGVAPAGTAMIGDTVSDARMAAVVGLPVAYDPDDPALAAACRAVLPAGRLGDLRRVLEAWPGT